MKSLLFLFLISVIHCAVPPNFKKCNRKDLNFKKCYLEAAQFGVTLLTRPYKGLDLPSLEPMAVAALTVRGTGGVVAVDQNFKNCNVSGLTTIKFRQFELDLDKKILDCDGTIPKFVLQCEYKVDGKVLLLAVQGEGDSVITMKNFRAKYHADFEEVRKSGKTYYKSVKTTVEAVPEHVHFRFDNLFNGHKELGDNINQVLNDNWFEIYEEMKRDYVELLRQIITQVMDKIWNKVSLEEFFD